MISLPTYLRIVRFSAWYDLIVTAGFATPWTFPLILANLETLSALLGISGSFPRFEPTHMLMANLLGSIVTVWAVLRLCATQAVFGRFDAAGRFLFATWQLYALAHNAHPIIWGFFAIEVALGIAQILPVALAGPVKNAGSRNEEVHS